MHFHSITQVKMNAMRKLFIKGELSTWTSPKALKLARSTVGKYLKEFERIKTAYPDKLSDMNFYMPEEKIQRRSKPRRLDVINCLPELLTGQSAGVSPKAIWLRYKEMFLDHYSYDNFNKVFNKWLIDHPEWGQPFLLKEIAKKDLKTLYQWRHCNDRRKWQIAVTLDMARNAIIANDIMAKVESTRDSVFNWIKVYKTTGLAGFETPKRITPLHVIARQKLRKDNLFKLLQETPKLHGINRTSWSITCLTPAYNKVYKETVSYMQISYCLRQMGYRYQKSRELLTSQDPHFREKIKAIQHTLQHLQPDEKFFSVDEYGPVGIKIKGGRTIRHLDDPQVGILKKQRSNGVVICTAALELSTNQITHFYSHRKNTFEMIKLLDMLLRQYHDQKKLFISWDAVSWHKSNILMNYIEDQNKLATGPIIKLMPLPSCTQYLNVIESVFGGLAVSVIHNSNYDSLDDCKAAIDLHFSARNEHFLAHPKRAGKKIWGNETVAPEFKITHHCRDSNAMRGAK